MEPGEPSRRTLPPPDLRRPEPPRAAPAEPLPRFAGRVAEEASLWARIDAAQAVGNTDAEWRASRTLALLLVERGRDLDLALEVAQRALEIGEDLELRAAVAQILEGTAQHARAAAELEHLAQVEADRTRAAQVLLRAGVLFARAGDADGARRCFVAAAALDPQDALALELSASLAYWAPNIVSRIEGAAHCVEAAERRAACGAAVGEREDLLRAFELDATSSAAARALAAELARRNLTELRDEVWRLHAQALAQGGTAQDLVALVHERRARDAVGAGDFARALGASLDGAQDAELIGPRADAFEELLLRAEWHEALAARLLVRAHRVPKEQGARLFQQLGSLLSGTLSKPTDALDALGSALLLDANADRARTLVDFAVPRGLGQAAADLLLEALREAPEAAPALVSVLGNLAEQIKDQALRAFAGACASELDANDEVARAATEEHDRIRSAVEEEAELIRQSLGVTAPGDARTDLLRSLGDTLSRTPLADAERLGVLEQILEARPDDRQVLNEAVRVARRAGRRDAVLRLVAAHPDQLPAENLRQALRRADWALALSLLPPPSSEAPASTLRWILAAASGDALLRGRALGACAPLAPPSCRAAVGAAAASALIALGALAEARPVAERACHADPRCASAVVCLAEACVDLRDRTAASVIERAIALSVPRGALAARLADILEELGELPQSVGWTQRWVALRPGDATAVRSLIGRVVRSGDAGRLLDTASWALSQPQPLAQLVEWAKTIAVALLELGAERAAVFGRRVLDLTGPVPELREPLHALALRAGDPAFPRMWLDRSLAADPAAVNASTFLQAAALCRAEGDDEGELRALLRALREGAPAPAVRANFDRLASARVSADAELIRLEAGVLLHLKDHAEARARALRAYGAALWGLADARQRAMGAWLTAAHLLPTRGYATLRCDLESLLGPQGALDELRTLVATSSDRRRAGALAGEAAKLAIAASEHESALEFAKAALELDSERTEALVVAERVMVILNLFEGLSEVYTQVAERARGRFGRRAAHFRAARFFEERGRADLAVKHACAAFVAVPTEGNTLKVLGRIANRAGEQEAAARAVEQVAELAKKGVRAGWLLRAAMMAPEHGLSGLVLRTDLLLRALAAAPAPATIALLGDTLAALIRLAPDRAEPESERLFSVSQEIRKRMEGPDGARVGIAITEIFVAVFADLDRAMGSLVLALSADADVDEYAALLPRAAALRGAADRAPLARIIELIEQPYANFGAPALSLLSALLEGVEPAAAALARTMLAEKEPDDESFLVQALAATHEHRQHRGRLAKKFPAGRMLQALQSRAAEEAPLVMARAAKTALSIVPPASRGEIEGVLEALGEPPVTSVPKELFDRLSGPDSRAAFAELDDHLRSDPNAALVLPSLTRSDSLPVREQSLLRLGRSREEVGDLGGAEKAYRQLLEAPGDLSEEASVGLEQVLSKRGAFSELSAFLATRVQSEEQRADVDVEMLRALRLRRAVLLEQRLGDVAGAVAELAAVLASAPYHEASLRYLADLFERTGKPQVAAEHLRRILMASPGDDMSRQALLVRIARCAFLAGDLAAARDHLADARELGAATVEAAELRVELARRTAEPVELAGALEELALSGAHDEAVQAEFLVEAAQNAAKVQDTDGAVRLARLAARFGPTLPAAQLFARGLEYRLRGAGKVDDAKVTLAGLEGLGGELEPEDAALRAFLMAEALDVLGDAARARSVLEEAQESGAHDQPLVAVGLAERMVRVGQFAEALPMYEQGLAGNLLGLRKVGGVAMAAADAARRAGRVGAANAWLNEAAKTAEFRLVALRTRAHIAATGGDIALAHSILASLAEGLEGDERAQVLAQLARILMAQTDADVRQNGREVFAEAMDNAVPDGLLHAQLTQEYERRSLASIPPRAEAVAVGFVSGPPAAQAAAPPADAAATDERSSPVPASRAERSLSLLRAAKEAVERGDAAKAEDLLWRASDDGSVAACDLLGDLLEKGEDRSQDVVRARRRALDLVPGDVSRLEALVRGARLDRNERYARAVEHVLSAFGGRSAAVTPPLLSLQPEQPGFLHLLQRHSREPMGSALGLVWEGAHGLLARKTMQYAINGLERVVPGPATPTGLIYEAILRVLDVPKVPLYVKRATGPLTFNVALLSPPNVVIHGDASRPGPGLAYSVGQALSATMNENVLLFGLDDDDARVMLQAVLSAFGPTESPPELDKDTGPLAEALWQTIPGSLQKRLKELLSSAPRAERSLVVERAKQSGRRMGYFACGDFAFSARAMLREIGRDHRDLEVPGALRQLCADLPSLSDLFRLAVRPEFADARWHEGNAGRAGGQG
jgi:cellulose synthase operon protein C